MPKRSTTKLACVERPYDQHLAPKASFLTSRLRKQARTGLIGRNFVVTPGIRIAHTRTPARRIRSDRSCVKAVVDRGSHVLERAEKSPCRSNFEETAGNLEDCCQVPKATNHSDSIQLQMQRSPVVPCFLLSPPGPDAESQMLSVRSLVERRISAATRSLKACLLALMPSSLSGFC